MSNATETGEKSIHGKYKIYIIAVIVIFATLMVGDVISINVGVNAKHRAVLVYSVDWQNRDKADIKTVKKYIKEDYKDIDNIKLTWSENDAIFTLMFDGYWMEDVLYQIEKGAKLEFKKPGGEVVLTGLEMKKVKLFEEYAEKGKYVNIITRIYGVEIFLTEEGSKIIYEVTKELSEDSESENYLELVINDMSIIDLAVDAPVDNGRFKLVASGKIEAGIVLKWFKQGMYPLFTLISDNS